LQISAYYSFYSYENCFNVKATFRFIEELLAVHKRRPKSVGGGLSIVYIFRIGETST